MEISLLPSKEDGYFAEINKYIYGKIPFEKEEYKDNRYELNRVSDFYKYMRVEFSANTDNIYFTLNNFRLRDNIDTIDFNKNNTNFNCQTYNGKTVALITFDDNAIKSVFISIFNREKNKPSKFVFKYDISAQNDFINIKTVDDEIKSNYDKNRIILDITLPEITSKPPEAKLNYIIKLIENNNYFENENLKTICLIESKVSKRYKISNPENNKNVTLTEMHNNTFYYVAINVDVETNIYNESFSYSYLINPTQEKKDNSKTTVIILGSVFGGVGLIGLLFLIYCLVLKKGNLIKSHKLTRKINSESNGEFGSVLND